MTNAEFVGKAKTLVRDYTNENLVEKNAVIGTDNVFMVWDCRILGNIKALFATTLRDGMYYEVTYNKQKDEIYLDAYRKIENRKY
jgi:hypothetical protein